VSVIRSFTIVKYHRKTKQKNRNNNCFFIVNESSSSSARRIFQIVFFFFDSRKEKSTQASVFVIRHQSLTHEKWRWLEKKTFPLSFLLYPLLHCKHFSFYKLIISLSLSHSILFNHLNLCQQRDRAMWKSKSYHSLALLTWNVHASYLIKLNHCEKCFIQHILLIYFLIYYSIFNF